MAKEGAYAHELTEPMTEEQIYDAIDVFRMFVETALIDVRFTKDVGYHGATKTYYDDEGIPAVHIVLLKTKDFFVLRHELAHCYMDFHHPGHPEPHGAEFDKTLEMIEGIL